MQGTVGELSGPGAYRAHLSDRTPVLLRPLRPADAPMLRAGYEKLSECSRAQRFLGASPARLDAGTLAYLAEVDQVGHLAWLAFAGPAGRRQGAGVVRGLPLAEAPVTAEIAVTIVDAWQRRGIGGLLLAVLARAALRQGIRRFRTWVAPDNRAVLGFFAALGVAPVPEAPGLLRVDAELAPILERLAVTAPRG